MNSGTMSTMTAAHTSTYYGHITGVPGLAVRAGRLLELWGTRAARPARRQVESRDELRLRHETELYAMRAVAEREATVTRQVYGGIR